MVTWSLTPLAQAAVAANALFGGGQYLLNTSDSATPSELADPVRSVTIATVAGWTIRRVGRDRHCTVECVTEHARRSRGIRPIRGDFQISNIGFLFLWPVYSRTLPSSSWKLAGNAAKPRAGRGVRTGQHIGRPKALNKPESNKPESDLARRVHASGESASTIAATLSVSRATVYRIACRKLLARSQSSGNQLRRRRGSAPCGLSRQLQVVDYASRL
jgi:hypothetical protein